MNSALHASTAKESEGNIRLDPVSLNPTCEYADDDDPIHQVPFHYAVFVAVDYLAAARAFALERGESKWLLAGFSGNASSTVKIA
ncbi:MAG: hypothetical protein IPM89_11030 [Candidatus Competibacteraceae bacterium]|nr:MAG: hypothetical protein IPM89_11030 [Candidatus Competibacteraceae bacterium]